MGKKAMTVPYVVQVTLREDAELDPTSFPGNLAFTHNLQLKFDSPVTFFVGENGSGKSTLLEAMAVSARLPISGGSMNELGADFAFDEQSELARCIRMAFKRQPSDRYFYRAENQTYFASLLDRRRGESDFPEDPYRVYGGRSLHQMSHGEAFLSILKNRFKEGLFLMDEPESALSPQRQLTLLALMHSMVRGGATQFFIATHSPIILTYPGANIISFDQGALEQIQLEETSHYQITRDLLNNPAMYWRHLAVPTDSRSNKPE